MLRAPESGNNSQNIPRPFVVDTGIAGDVLRDPRHAPEPQEIATLPNAQIQRRVAALRRLAQDLGVKDTEPDTTAHRSSILMDHIPRTRGAQRKT